MSSRTNLDYIARAEAETLTSPTEFKFDVVEIRDDAWNIVNLFLPEGTGQAVADAINAAVANGGE